MDPSGLTVFEALERELGVKLGVKLEVQKHTISVVDHINEQPKQEASVALLRTTQTMRGPRGEY